MDFERNFAVNIYRLRVEHGLTQARLAREAMVCGATISSIERSASRHTGLTVAVLLARALGVSVDDLIAAPPADWAERLAEHTEARLDIASRREVAR